MEQHGKQRQQDQDNLYPANNMYHPVVTFGVARDSGGVEHREAVDGCQVEEEESVCYVVEVYSVGLTDYVQKEHEK